MVSTVSLSRLAPTHRSHSIPRQQIGSLFLTLPKKELHKIQITLLSQTAQDRSSLCDDCAASDYTLKVHRAAMILGPAKEGLKKPN